jgi:hypothetical protein
MVEKAGKVENKKVKEEETGNGKEAKRPLETVNIFTTNGMLSFSVWEGGSISVRVSKKEGDDYTNVWTGRISPIDFITQFGDLKAIARSSQQELKKLIGEEI